MRFDFSVALPHVRTYLPLAGTAALITFILAFIFVRRVVRARYCKRRDQRVQLLRENWEKIVSGEIGASEWLFCSLDRDIVEATALDRMEVATPEEAGRLETLFRLSGLLDRAKNQARKSRGWRRRDALLRLGRMRAAEAVPILVEALEQFSDGISVAAVRALGRIGTPDAGAAIIRSLRDTTAYPAATLHMALANCFRRSPEQLLSFTLDASDPVRALLARVLAEVAITGMRGEFLALASDPEPDVRASAARIVAVARPACAADLISQLASDPEWFVRLRSVIALGELADPITIPVLMRSLCDRNRLVRLRAAVALAAMEGSEPYILTLAMRTKDQYALQALISEMERSGKISRMVDLLATGSDPLIERALLAAVRAGAVRFLVDLAARHPNPLGRKRLSSLLARSSDPSVLESLDELDRAVAGEVPGRPEEQRLEKGVTPLWSATI